MRCEIIMVYVVQQPSTLAVNAVFLRFVVRNLRAMLVCLIELRAGNWGRTETDRTVGAGDSMQDAAPGTGNPVCSRLANFSLLSTESVQRHGFCVIVMLKTALSR